MRVDDILQSFSSPAKFSPNSVIYTLNIYEVFFALMILGAVIIWRFYDKKAV